MEAESKKCCDTDVFNFSVAEDESYLTTGGLLHNCSYPRGKFSDLTDTMTQFLLWARDSGYLLYGVEHRLEEMRAKAFTRRRNRVSEMVEGT